MSYNKRINLEKISQTKVKCLIDNLKVFNGKCLILPKAQVVIQTDVSLKGWGANCAGVVKGGKWSLSAKALLINRLELLALKNAVLTFTKNKQLDCMYMQMDNTAVLSYLLKIGGTKNNSLIKMIKEIWTYLITNQITNIAEYHPEKLSVRADWQSRHSKDFSV